MLDPLKLDPSRTGAIRRGFLRDINTKYDLLAYDVWNLLVTQDAFGLTTPNPFTLNVRWKFRTSDEKITAFQEWFIKQVEAGVLAVDTITGEPWTSKYVHNAYKLGIIRAYIDSKMGINSTSKAFTKGGQEEFLRQAFTQPEMISKLKMLSTRTFEQLKGVTAQMGQNMNRILTEGISKGSGPREIARNLRKSIKSLDKARAERIARTEIIHAHAEGQLDSLQQLGIDEVGALVEWATAGDARVCPQCQDLAGIVMTIKEARGLIPRHPNCRCAWLPAIGGKNQKTIKSAIQKSIQRSVQAERPNSSLATAQRKSQWAGAGRSVSTK